MAPRDPTIPGWPLSNMGWQDPSDKYEMQRAFNRKGIAEAQQEQWKRFGLEGQFIQSASKKGLLSPEDAENIRTQLADTHPNWLDVSEDEREKLFNSRAIEWLERKGRVEASAEKAFHQGGFLGPDDITSTPETDFLGQKRFKTTENRAFIETLRAHEDEIDLPQALMAGSQNLPPELMAEFQERAKGSFMPPEKFEKSRFMSFLETPGRAAQAGKARETSIQARGQAPLTEHELQTVEAELGLETIYERAERTGPSAFMGGTMPEEKIDVAPTRQSGAPQATMPEASFKEVGGAMWDAALAGSDNKEDLAEELYKVKDFYAKESMRMANMRARQQTFTSRADKVAFVKKEAMHILNDVVPHLEQRALDNPEGSRLAYQFVGDFLMDPTSAILGTAKAAVKVAKELPFVGAITELGLEATKSLSKTGALRASGHPSGQYLADTLLAAADKGQATSQAVEKLAGQAEKAAKKLPKDLREPFYQLLSGEKTLEELPARLAKQLEKKNLTKRVEQYKEAMTGMYEAGAESGALQRITDRGQVELAGQVPDYVPRKKFEATAAPEEEVAAALGLPATKKGKGKIASGAEQARQDSARPAVADVEAQLKVSLPAQKRAIAVGTEFKEMKKALKASGMELSEHSPQTFAAIAKTTKETGKAAKAVMREGFNVQGVPMAPLSEQASKEWLRMTSAPGQKLSQQQVFLPKPFTQRIEELVPTMGNQEKHVALVAADVANEYLAKPAMSLWRSGVLSASGWHYFLTQVQGDIGLNVLANGLKGLNPEVNGKALAAAVIDAAVDGSKSKTAGKIKYKLPSGEETTIAGVLDIMKEYGLKEMNTERFGKAMQTGKSIGGVPNIFAAGAKAAQWATLQPLFFKAAAIPDQVYRISTFMNNLKSLKHADITRAVQLTSDLSGNFNRMTKFEKKVMREVVPFYSWNRFYLPFAVKQSIKHPNRLKVMERTKDYLESKYFAAEAPAFEEGTPEWQKGQGMMTAPKRWQKDVPSGSFVTMRVETPASAFAMFDRPVMDFANPAVHAMLFNLMGYDPESGMVTQSGEEIVTDLSKMYDNLGPKKMSKKAMGKLLDTWGGPSKAAMHSYELMMRQGQFEQAGEFMGRLAASRHLGPFEKLVFDNPVGSGGIVDLYGVTPDWAVREKAKKAAETLKKKPSAVK